MRDAGVSEIRVPQTPLRIPFPLSLVLDGTVIESDERTLVRGTGIPTSQRLREVPLGANVASKALKFTAILNYCKLRKMNVRRLRFIQPIRERRQSH